MISANEQAWNSATTLYLARKLAALAAENDRPLRVLDMGCGDGTIIAALHPYDHDLYGYDFAYRSEAQQARLRPLFGEAYEDHIRIATSERVIPFADGSFDVIYANQVFEHVRFLDAMLAECARVLKPGGTLVTLFPFVTYPVEGHTLIPFVHWLPPGAGRVRYMTACLRLWIGRRHPGMNATQSAHAWEDYLNTGCFYRLKNEVVSLSEYYFQAWEIDTRAYITAKLDLLDANGTPHRRLMSQIGRVLHRRWLDYLITHYFGAVFVAQHPR